MIVNKAAFTLLAGLAGPAGLLYRAGTVRATEDHRRDRSAANTPLRRHAASLTHPPAAAEGSRDLEAVFAPANPSELSNGQDGDVDSKHPAHDNSALLRGHSNPFEFAVSDLKAVVNDEVAIMTDVSDDEPEIKLVPSDGGYADYFGRSVAVSGNRAVVGSYKDDDKGYNAGAAYVFEFDVETGDWFRMAKLLADDGDVNDYFGSKVAMSGNIVVIGASYDDDDGSLSGSAYIFELDTDACVWEQTAKLTADDAAGGDYFGVSVAIMGHFAIIGAYGGDDDGINSGSAYVFELDVDTGDWIQRAKLTANDGAAYDYFGMSVAIDGTVAVIGADRDDDNGSDSGSVYIFELDADTGDWTQTAKLVADDGAAGDRFGKSVAISENHVIVGAHLSDDNGSNSGSAYIFEKDQDTNTWKQTAKLLATDGSEDDNFGCSVAMSENVAIIGANKDDDKGSNSGSAYVFELENGVWEERGKLTASDGAADDSFGYSVSIEGSTAVVGSPEDDDKASLSGSAYVFELSDFYICTITQDYSDGSNGNWELVSTIGTDPSDITILDNIDEFVVPEGTTVIVIGTLIVHAKEIHIDGILDGTGGGYPGGPASYTNNSGKAPNGETPACDLDEVGSCMSEGSSINGKGKGGKSSSSSSINSFHFGSTGKSSHNDSFVYFLH